MRYRFWKSANVWRLAFGRRFHAGEVVGFAHGEPPFRHLGLGVALSAVHDRSAMGLVTGGAFQLFVMGPMGVVGAHVSGLLIQIVAGEVVAGLVQAQLVGVAADAFVSSLAVRSTSGKL